MATKEEIQDAYNKAWAGGNVPTVAMLNVPGIGYVVVNGDLVFVNEEPATDEQIAKVREYLSGH